jgi:hypothetical protein
MACSTHGEGEEEKSKYKVIVGKPEEKRPLGRRRWEDNIKIYL